MQRYLLWCGYAGSSFEVKIETDSNDAMEIKIEADSNENQCKKLLSLKHSVRAT